MSRVRLGLFCSGQPNRAWFGKWGYKVQLLMDNGVYVTEHKTPYKFDTREDALKDAKEYMTTYHPGEWRDRGGRKEKI